MDARGNDVASDAAAGYTLSELPATADTAELFRNQSASSRGSAP
jgi:hypothetical protein